MTPTLLETALAFARAGFPVFPVSAQKTPLTEHGFKDATRDESVIYAWWTRWPDAGIGIPTGAISGIIVLDIDPRHGGDESFDKLIEQCGPLPRGPVVHTGGGGTHRWFRHPGGSVPPSHGFRPGLDLQGDGAYVIVPPSPHSSGNFYRWEVSLEATRLPMPPPWLLDVAESDATGPTRAKFYVGTDGKIPHGRRHDYIVSLAASVVSRTPGIDEAQAIRLVKATVHNVMDVDARTDSDVEQAVRSALGKFWRPPDATAAPSPPAKAGAIPVIPSEPAPAKPLRPLFKVDPESGKATADQAAFVEVVMAQNYFATYLDTEELLRFDGGYYNGHAPQFIKKWVEEKFQSQDKTAQDRFRKEIINAVIARSYVPRDDFNPEGWICLENGLLDLRTVGAHDFLDHHDPTLKLTFRLGVPYQKGAQCPKFLKFLLDSIPKEDSRLAVQEMFGYCLRGGNPYKRAFFLVGKPDSGKSTLVEILRGILGRENTSTVSLQNLADAKWYNALLWGKLANIYADLSPRIIRDAGAFKMLTGGADEVPAEKKFQTPFSFVNKAKLIFSANELPAFPKADDAFFLRWEVVEFPASVPKEKQIKNLDKLLVAEEGPGILVWALEGLHRLELRGDFASGGSPEEIRRQWQRLSNSLAWFVDEMLEEDRGGKIEKTDLWNAYQDFCDLHGVEPRGQADLTKELPEMLRHVELRKTTVGGRGGSQPKMWFGVRFKGSTPSVEQLAADFDTKQNSQAKLDAGTPSTTTQPGLIVHAGAHAQARGLIRPEDGSTGSTEPPPDPDPEDLFSGRATRADHARASLALSVPEDGIPEVTSSPTPPPTGPPTPPVGPLEAARVDAACELALRILRDHGPVGETGDGIIRALEEQGFSEREAMAALGRIAGSGNTTMQGDLFFLKDEGAK